MNLDHKLNTPTDVESQILTRHITPVFPITLNINDPPSWGQESPTPN